MSEPLHHSNGRTARVLIAPSSFLSLGPDGTGAFGERGIEVRVNPHGRPLTAAEVVDLARDCDGILAGNEPLTADVLARLPRLRCISRCGSGTDNVDLDAARARGIQVLRTPDAPVKAVAELTVGLLLTLLRGIHLVNPAVHNGDWPRLRGGLLAERTVGIVGLGRIGQAVARLLAPFGCDLLASDLDAGSAVWARGHDVPLVALDDLLARADIVSLHAAPGVRPLLGARELALMPRGALLVNTARGSLVDEAALLRACRTGHLGGAALDVFAEEPYRGPLSDVDNIVLTPHIGSFTAETRTAMELQAVNHLIDGLGYR
ncbi:D-3-phosphoglycerate dehydrogenase [Actinokineospora baliensis]|uniref:phosphoglycerate dehydrogenase n=1 Tax=Actinokineospora baliensis TaxID=547056 RepID=UPI001959669D|nr:phosphoglycerate dehydrogenase [Actinokineospora baliensis]MBM7775517.1 D-3-phosphoglycerate dehydrogenase [Actinokineospora baliensis]